MSLRVQEKKREKGEQKRAEQHVIVGKTNQTAPVLEFFSAFFFCTCWQRVYNGRGTIFRCSLTDGIDDITGGKLKHKHGRELSSSLPFTPFPGERQPNADTFDIFAPPWCIQAALAAPVSPGALGNGQRHPLEVGGEGGRLHLGGPTQPATTGPTWSPGRSGAALFVSSSAATPATPTTERTVPDGADEASTASCGAFLTRRSYRAYEQSVSVIKMQMCLPSLALMLH